MIAVIFEVSLRAGQEDAYLDMAAQMLALLDEVEGFVSVERFQSLAQPDKLLSLSFFRDEVAVAQWREMAAHRRAQKAGRMRMFADYRLRVVQVIRDYGKSDRNEAPGDSRALHGG